MAAVRDDFDALRQHLSLGGVIVLGWSNGGMNSIKYAAANPKAVSHLILLHTIDHVSQEFNAEFAQKYPDVAEAYYKLFQPGRSEEEQDADFRELFKNDYARLLVKDFETHRRRIAEILDSADMSWAHNVYQLQRDMPGFDAREDLKVITAPTLIIAGRHDLLPADDAEAMGDGIRNSRFVVLENSAHFGSIEEPEKFINTVMDFLGR